jgi:mono/diheme cytochrome c family protein
MRTKENYFPLISVALVLTVAILISFQLYIFNEPARIAGVMAHDSEIAVSAGQTLFQTNCTLCHGDNGEGTPGRPSLNDKHFLDTTSDDRIFSIISSGVPNTEMPAWNQSHGGPLTDEDVSNLVAFVRAWEPTAPDRSNVPPPGDLTKGRGLYGSVCAICHGDKGQGSGQGSALNDATKLNQFDDAWYRDAITSGRPAKGMPTWGTVLSPQQVSDLISVIDYWRRTAVAVATPVTTTANGVEIARPSNPGGAGPALNLTGDPKSGKQLFADNCQKCHGENGVGGVDNPGSDDGTVPSLNPIDETLISSDPQVYAYNLDLFIEHGSTPAGTNPRQSMPAWGDENKLTPQQIADLIAYVMSLNPASSSTSATAIPTVGTPEATAASTTQP